MSLTVLLKFHQHYTRSILTDSLAQIFDRMKSGKNDGLRYEVHHFFPCAVEISFLHTKVCGNAIPEIRNGFLM